MMQIIDRFLNRFTMYRLTLYYLVSLLALGLLLSAFGIVPVDALGILSSTVILLAACLGTNALFAGNPRMTFLTSFVNPDPRKFTFTTTVSF